jgi:hypothetical protein
MIPAKNIVGLMGCWCVGVSAALSGENSIMKSSSSMASSGVLEGAFSIS